MHEKVELDSREISELGGLVTLEMNGDGEARELPMEAGMSPTELEAPTHIFRGS
jgi:hypothetical protein